MKMEIGAQSYTVRKYCQTAEDLAATLEKIAAIGYRNIQLSAIGPIEPEVVKELCDRNGLRIVVELKKDAEGVWRMDFEDMERKIRRHHIHAFYNN